MNEKCDSWLNGGTNGISFTEEGLSLSRYKSKCAVHNTCYVYYFDPRGFCTGYTMNTEVENVSYGTQKRNVVYPR